MLKIKGNSEIFFNGKNTTISIKNDVLWFSMSKSTFWYFFYGKIPPKSLRKKF